MDKKFLDKVVDQIVSETEIDYDKEEVYFLLFIPFSVFSLYSSFDLRLSPSRSRVFSKHCKDVYGLNEQEIEYVWRVYSDDIRYKIKNNG